MIRVVITDRNFGQGEIEQEVLGDGFEVVADVPVPSPSSGPGSWPPGRPRR